MQTKIKNAVFSDDDTIEGVFLIKASSVDVFLNRKSKLAELTGFAGCAYEEDEDGGIFKIITTGCFCNTTEVKSVIERIFK